MLHKITQTLKKFRKILINSHEKVSILPFGTCITHSLTCVRSSSLLWSIRVSSSFCSSHCTLFCISSITIRHDICFMFLWVKYIILSPEPILGLFFLGCFFVLLECYNERNILCHLIEKALWGISFNCLLTWHDTCEYVISAWVFFLFD